jgi:tetratricopeptide (TPR) repeat protein
LANQLVYAGRYDVARQIVEEIIDRKPNFSAAYRVLADIAVYGDYQLVEALQKIHKAIMLDPYHPANYMLSGWVYRELGENELAIRSFDQLLQIAPDFGGALLARGVIYELRSEPNKAFETYLLISEKSGWTKVLMFYLMEAGVKTNRSPEVIEHFREIYPSLFQADVLIDQSNYTSALALGRLLKAKGESGQAHHLLKGSLKVVQEETTSDWNSKVNNWEWESRVHLAMSNKEAALTSFVKLVAEGVYSDKIVRDPVYQLLYDESEFQRSMEIMKERLKEERAIVKEMEANGELDIPPLPNK